MPKTSFSPYAESPLATLLAEALADIQALKNKYGLHQEKTANPELMELSQLVKLIESIFTLLHHTVLPAFSEGKTPGFFTIGKILAKGYQLNSMIQALDTPERPVLRVNADNVAGNDLVRFITNQLKIDLMIHKHPMIYELMQSTTRLLQKAPAPLEALAPFFNPKSVINLLHSGALSHILSWCQKFTLEHVPVENADETTYIYQLNVKNRLITFDMAQVVNDSRYRLLAGLMEFINQKNTTTQPEYLPLVSRLDIPPVEIIEQHASLVALEESYISLLQDKTSKLTAPLEEEYAQQRLFEQLCSIQSSLENHKHTRNIPFKEIDQIMALQPRKKGENTGFADLLNVLGDATFTKELQTYRKKQDNLLTPRPAASKFCEIHQQLSQTVSQKITALNQQLAILDDCAQLKMELKRTIATRLSIEPEYLLLQEQRANRAAWVATMLPKLQTYIHYRGQRHQLKDRLTSHDKQQRIEYIRALEATLQNYVTSGSSIELLESVQHGIHRFPGKKLRPLLHSFMEEILDIEQEQPPVAADSVIKNLSLLTTTHPAYANTLKTLYEQIAKMRHHAATQPDDRKRAIHDLACKLTKDTDAFIKIQGNSLPSNGQFQAFSQKISSRLNSRSHLIEQDSTWGYIVANIALVLLLIPKLIVSKSFQGHCSFFFDKTNTSAFMESIENTVQRLCQI